MHSVARPLPTSHSINTSPVTLPEFRSPSLGGDFDPVTESGGASTDYTSFSTATRTGAVVNIIQFICECAFGTWAVAILAETRLRTVKFPPILTPKNVI